MQYRRLCSGLNDKGILIPSEADLGEYIFDGSQDHYLSVYKYSQDQFNEFQQTGTVQGITEVVTDKLAFDFDAEDLEQAKLDALELYNRLISKGFKDDSISITFSGGKGFGVEVKIDRDITPTQHKNIALSISEGLNSFDSKMYNASRIWRVTNTKHNKTKLFKVELSPNQLNLSIEAIKRWASTDQNVSYLNTQSLPEALVKTMDVAPTLTPTKNANFNPDEIDFTKKPKGWTNCKWALVNGYTVMGGGRHEKLLCIAAQAKALNYTKEQAYLFAKEADRIGSLKGNTPRISKAELWDNIIGDVYSITWNGGTFSCREGKTPWLVDVCNKLGPNKCKHDEDKVFVEMNELCYTFNKFSNELEQNKITTGIKELDDNVILCTSTLVGLLGNPGSGKSTLSLNILNNCSKNNINSIFFSMDMGVPLVYLKLIQKHLGISHDEAFNIFRNDKQRSIEISKIIEAEYKNVKFCFKSGLDVDAIRESIIKHQETTGQKTKLIVLDYLECIVGQFSDQNANTAIIANKLKDLANETETCILLLLQTQKHAAAPDEPLLSMKNIKGSSVIEQAASVILTIWREGYSPKYASHDKFISIATVKDRFNSLWKHDFSWDGLTGKIRELEDNEQDDLEKLRSLKKQDKLGELKPFDLSL